MIMEVVVDRTSARYEARAAASMAAVIWAISSGAEM
jgi:hypothetical protein